MLKKFKLFLAIIFAVSAVFASQGELVQVHGTSGNDGKIVFTVISSGFTQAERSTFLDKYVRQNVVHQIINTYPFTLFSDRINIYAVFVPSTASGTLNVGLGTAQTIALAHNPTCRTHIILENREDWMAIATQTSREIVLPRTMAEVNGVTVHEIAHSFAQIRDEFAGDFLEAPNVQQRIQGTASTATVRWASFFGVPAVADKVSAINSTLTNYPHATTNPWTGRYMSGGCPVMSASNLSGAFSTVNAAALIEMMALYAGEPFYGTLYHPTAINGNAAARRPADLRIDPLNSAIGGNHHLGVVDNRTNITFGDNRITGKAFPNGRDRILDFAFHGVSSLQKLTIPASVETIGIYAFLRCTGLTEITNNAATPQPILASGAAGDQFFGVNRANITLRVPEGTKQAYINAGWTGFKEIIDDLPNEDPTCEICEKFPCGCDDVPVCEDCNDEGCAKCDPDNVCDVCGEYGDDCVCENETSITNFERSNKHYGIRFAQNPVSDNAEISVILPNNERIAEMNVIIYDMTGNVVFDRRGRIYSTLTDDGAIVWDLRNRAGRFVANGAYLVVVEARDRNGEVYRYSTRLGVRR